MHYLAYLIRNDGKLIVVHIENQLVVGIFGDVLYAAAGKKHIAYNIVVGAEAVCILIGVLAVSAVVDLCRLAKLDELVDSPLAAVNKVIGAFKRQRVQHILIEGKAADAVKAGDIEGAGAEIQLTANRKVVYGVVIPPRVGEIDAVKSVVVVKQVTLCHGIDVHERYHGNVKVKAVGAYGFVG